MSAMIIPRLEIGHTALLVVDMQEKLLPHMHNADQLVAQAGKLIDAANALNIQIVVTEQYRKGLGVTVPYLATRLDKAVANHEKLKFSGCIEPVRADLQRFGSRAVIVCGIEAHVCVLQTCLDLAEDGYIVAVATDAIGSRRVFDQQVAEQRLAQAGIIPITVESAALELVGEAGTVRFKAVLPIIK